LYLIKPLLERMNIKSTIDSIIPERKENEQILTTGKVAEILVANRLHNPLYLDNKKALGVFGWKPEYSLEDGLRETIEYNKRVTSNKAMKSP